MGTIGSDLKASSSSFALSMMGFAGSTFVIKVSENKSSKAQAKVDGLMSGLSCHGLNFISEILGSHG